MTGPTATSLLGLRVAVAGAATLAIGFTAFVAVAIGFGHYSEDLCLTAVRAPDGAGSVSGPDWTTPLSYECDFGSLGTVTTHDPFPLIGTLVGGAATLAVVAALWWFLVGEALWRRRARAIPAPDATAPGAMAGR